MNKRGLSQAPRPHTVAACPTRRFVQRLIFDFTYILVCSIYVYNKTTSDLKKISVESYLDYEK
jgi:hypothetical protein